MIRWSIFFLALSWKQCNTRQHDIKTTDTKSTLPLLGLGTLVDCYARSVYIAIVHLASANIIITMDRSDIIAIAVVSASVVYIALASYFDYPLDDRDIPLPPYH